MDTRILFTDLDGTLLDDSKKITPGNQTAIDEALAQGHKIVISTGRPLAGAWAQAEKLGLTKEGCYAITYNGGQIYDSYHRKTIYGSASEGCQSIQKSRSGDREADARLFGNISADGGSIAC